MAAAAVYKGMEQFRAGDYATVTTLFTTVGLHLLLLELIMTVFYSHTSEQHNTLLLRTKRSKVYIIGGPLNGKFKVNGTKDV